MKMSSATLLEKILKNKRGSEQLQGELRNLNLPMFDDEKNAKESKMWLLDIRRYLPLHGYTYNLEAMISIYNIQGKASTWWQYLKQVKQINYKKISCDEFSNYFKEKYLVEDYYEGKMQEFFELKLGPMTMDEYENKFSELLKYVDFIKDEKVNIHICLHVFPSFYKC